MEVDMESTSRLDAITVAARGRGAGANGREADVNFVDQTTAIISIRLHIESKQRNAECHFAYMDSAMCASRSRRRRPVQLEKAVASCPHDVKPVGSFTSSNALLNQIETIWLRTQLNTCIAFH